MTTLDQAVNYLRSILKPGPLPATEMQARCAVAGYSPATVRRAKKTLQVQTRRRQDDGRYPHSGLTMFHWEWALTPGNDEHLSEISVICESSLVEQFVNACLVFDPQAACSGLDLVNRLHSWCGSQGLGGGALEWSEVSTYLTEQGCSCVYGQGFTWRGVTIRE